MVSNVVSCKKDCHWKNLQTNAKFYAQGQQKRSSGGKKKVNLRQMAVQGLPWGLKGLWMVSRCLLQYCAWNYGSYRKDVSKSKKHKQAVRKFSLYFQKIYNLPHPRKGHVVNGTLTIPIFFSCVSRTWDSSSCVCPRKKGRRLTFPVAAASLSIFLCPSFVSSLSFFPSLHSPPSLAPALLMIPRQEAELA